MIERKRQQQTVQRLLARNPVVAILGTRQVGKATLARTVVRQDSRASTILDLERTQDLARLEDPELGLRDLKGIGVLDEIQRRAAYPARSTSMR